MRSVDPPPPPIALPPADLMPSSTRITVGPPPYFATKTHMPTPPATAMRERDKPAAAPGERPEVDFLLLSDGAGAGGAGVAVAEGVEAMLQVAPDQPLEQVHTPVPPCVPPPLQVPCTQGAQAAQEDPQYPGAQSWQLVPAKLVPQVPHTASPAHCAGQSQETESTFGVPRPLQKTVSLVSRHTVASTVHTSPCSGEGGGG